jgi:hypothetical protein
MVGANEKGGADGSQFRSFDGTCNGGAEQHQHRDKDRRRLRPKQVIDQVIDAPGLLPAGLARP